MSRFTLALIALFTLTACETVKGAGEDLQSAGKGISSGAAQIQDDLR